MQEEVVLEHPFVAVSMEQVGLTHGRVIMNRPKIYVRDYVSALVLNDAGEALIIEGYNHGTSGCSWQVIGAFLEEGEDPHTAVQRELLEEIGYRCDKWLYLGTYIEDANQHAGVSHFFFATGAQSTVKPTHNGLEALDIKWVPVKDLKYALVDGRIGVVSYAANIALALLLLEKKIQLPA